MDALSLLTADHNRVRGLFARFQSAEEEKDTATMTELAAKIIVELEVHTTIEEEIFYPEIQGADEELKDTVDEGIEEHRVAKTLIGEIKMLTAEDDAWVAKMKVLIESVEHHAEEEEQEMFPETRKNFDKAALEDGLESFPGCAVVISHDRWFLDRICTHVLAFEGDSQVRWFEGNFADYEVWRRKELGAAADQPHRIKYRPLVR